jgi:hypothetical protein
MEAAWTTRSRDMSRRRTPITSRGADLASGALIHQNGISFGPTAGSSVRRTSLLGTLPNRNNVPMRRERRCLVCGSALACRDIARTRIQVIVDKFTAVITEASSNEAERSDLTQLLDRTVADGRSAVTSGQMDCRPPTS